MGMWESVKGWLGGAWRRNAPDAPDEDSGAWGEAQAARYLRGKGFRVLGRRVRVGDRDELDLVCRDGEVLVFVEVKTRGGEDFGRPASAVDAKKRHVMSRAAVRYLKKLRYPRIYYRFDVVEVVGHPGGEPAIRHIESAFVLDPHYRPPY